MEFDDLKYDSFDDLEYHYEDEQMTVWQALEIDYLMTKPTMLTDFEMRNLGEVTTYGEALERISLLKENQR